MKTAQLGVEYPALASLDEHFQRAVAAFLHAAVQDVAYRLADDFLARFPGGRERGVIGIDDDPVAGDDQGRVLDRRVDVFPLGDGGVVFLVGSEPVRDVEPEQHHADRALVDVGLDRTMPVYGAHITAAGLQ